MCEPGIVISRWASLCRKYFPAEREKKKLFRIEAKDILLRPRFNDTKKKKFELNFRVLKIWNQKSNKKKTYNTEIRGRTRTCLLEVSLIHNSKTETNMCRIFHWNPIKWKCPFVFMIGAIWSQSGSSLVLSPFRRDQGIYEANVEVFISQFDFFQSGDFGKKKGNKEALFSVN